MKTVIPIIMQPDTEKYFWVRSVLDGIRSSAARYDYELLVADRDIISKGFLPKNRPVLVNGHMAEWLSDTAVFLWLNGYIPIIISAGTAILRRCRYSSVYFDLASGVQDIVDYCIAGGRRNIALFGVRSRVSGDWEKVQLFRRSAAECGLEEFPVYYLEDTLEKCMDRFIEAFFENNIDAIVCANDSVAILLIQEMLKNGIKIPEDAYVVGVGDSVAGRLISVPLISLNVDYFEMGKQAVRLWRYIYRDGADTDISVAISCKLNTKNVGGEPLKRQKYEEHTFTDSGEGLWNDYFYEDEKVQRLLKLETLLRDCDELDLALLEAIKNEKTDEQIADEVWLSSRAVRYRISKMMKKADMQGRSEIVALMREFNIWEK